MDKAPAEKNQIIFYFVVKYKYTEHSFQIAAFHLQRSLIFVMYILSAICPAQIHYNDRTFTVVY